MGTVAIVFVFFLLYIMFSCSEPAFCIGVGLERNHLFTKPKRRLTPLGCWVVFLMSHFLKSQIRYWEISVLA